jgi:hypothetical protein
MDERAEKKRRETDPSLALQSKRARPTSPSQAVSPAPLDSAAPIVPPKAPGAAAPAAGFQLPDMFDGVRAYLLDSVSPEEARFLKRHILGYAGDVVTSMDEATHVIFDDGVLPPAETLRNSAKAADGRTPVLLRSSWVRACIRAGKLVDVGPFVGAGT